MLPPPLSLPSPFPLIPPLPPLSLPSHTPPPPLSLRLTSLSYPSPNPLNPSHFPLPPLLPLSSPSHSPFSHSKLGFIFSLKKKKLSLFSMLQNYFHTLFLLNPAYRHFNLYCCWKTLANLQQGELVMMYVHFPR